MEIKKYTDKELEEMYIEGLNSGNNLFRELIKSLMDSKKEEIGKLLN